MTWARIDDVFPDHPKVVELSDRAFRVHVAAICYAARHLTDGHIPKAAVPGLAAGRKAAVTELVRSGLWDKNGNGGFVIHDYLDYNPSREEIEAERERKRQAGLEGAKKRWQKR